MKIVEIKVSKAKVYHDVAMSTSYTGHKLKDDASAYDRIFTTDEDREQLERFWREACSVCSDRLKRFYLLVQGDGQSSAVSHGVDLSVVYAVRLSMPDVFVSSLRESIESSLHSFFVLFIISRWFRFVHKEEAESYAADAAGMLGNALRQLRYRQAPTLKTTPQSGGAPDTPGRGMEERDPLPYVPRWDVEGDTTPQSGAAPDTPGREAEPVKKE